MAKTERIQNMTKGSPAKLIFTFAIPLMLGNVFQQFYTVVDTAIVGQALGVNALAALGAADWLNWLVLGLIQGFAQGFSIYMAQRFGAEDHEGLNRSIGATISLSAVISILTVILSQVAMAPVLRAMNTPEEIIGGASYLVKMFGVDKAIIGVEDNKKNGIDALNRVIAETKAPVIVVPLHCRYPQGGEKQLCQAITGKQVPPGGLPANIGCAVFNINTTIAIYHAIKDGMPVVRKVVTVSGSGVVEPKNLECPIGTPVSLLFDACGGLKDETFKLIAGGPMMGMAQASADFPVAKGTGAVLAFAANENKVSEDPTCIRCGKCAEVCPVGLLPFNIASDLRRNDTSRLRELHVMDCIECGSCAYNCPAHIPLVQYIRMGKQFILTDGFGGHNPYYKK